MEADKQGFFKETQQLAENYLKDRLTLLKLQIAEKTARLAAVVFTGVVIGVFVMLALVFFSLLAVYVIKDKTGSWYYGLGMVTAFYVVLVSVVFIFRKPLLYGQISNAVIKIFFEETANIHDEQKF